MAHDTDVLARAKPPEPPGSHLRYDGLTRMFSEALGSRWLPFVCGAWGFALVWLLWGSLDAVAVGNDEMSYLIQARIFAAGSLVAPGLPLPEFFQQFHVFVAPVLASKYPPGHAFLLVPGVWLGVPGLVPALLAGVTATLLAALTRRFSNGSIAVLAVFLATTSDVALRFDPSYFSETTTSALFLIGWWAILAYWERGQLRWLIACALAVGWGGITRPVTMLGFAAPAAVCALLAMHRHHRWRDLLPSLVSVIAVLALQAIWDHRVVGNWRTMPYTEYSRLYLPADRLGFHTATAPPPVAHLTADEQAAERLIRRSYDRYTIADVPTAATERAVNVIRGTWPYGGAPGIAILFAAAFLPVAVTRVVLATIIFVFVAYLAWPMDPAWTLYFLEFQAPLAFMTAVGLYAAARWSATFVSRTVPRFAVRERNLRIVFLLAASAWLVLPAIPRIASYRVAHAEQRDYRERFRRAVADLPPVPSIVFVQDAPGHGEQRLVDNVPDLASARTWVVHDRGSDNARLMALAPNRVPYLSREEHTRDSLVFHMERLRPDGVPPAERAP